MNLSLGTGIPALTVFIQGIISFMSPCILPLVPVYIGYLAGGAKTTTADGKIHYPRKKVMINTLFFVLGISFAFILLGIGFTAAGRFFEGNRMWFVRIGGIIMILFGAYQLGIFGQSKVIETERKLPFHLDRWAANPLTAFVFGFTFSFAWTPCVGPVLTSVLLMASTAKSAASGFLLVGVYIIGFILPFLAVGLFTGTVIGWFDKYKNVVKYTVKAGGVLLIIMGVMTMTGWVNGITGYLSAGGNVSSSSEQKKESRKEEAKEEKNADTSDKKADEKKQEEVIPVPDFEVKDQFGATHKLSDYKGKTVMLNFWATWCGYCKKEMPDLQKAYEKYGKNQEDLVILGVSEPKTDENPNANDVSQEEITEFLDSNGYSYPVLMDTTGEIFGTFGIRSFPTTYMIDKEGNLIGYIPGAVNASTLENIIQESIAK